MASHDCHTHSVPDRVRTANDADAAACARHSARCVDVAVAAVDCRRHRNSEEFDALACSLAIAHPKDGSLSRDLVRRHRYRCVDPAVDRNLISIGFFKGNADGKEKQLQMKNSI